MFNTIYLEDSIRSHPRTLAILDRFPNIPRVICDRYSEVFNPKAQSFRLQKKNPSLILAQKFNNFVLPAPESYGIGASQNFYFSHMLNCLYDCRYCFLQGMYQSAHYVLFVNYEDFQSAIENTIASLPDENLHFFSGYDCDSMAFEPISHFAEFFLPFFKNTSRSLMELRTKSTQIRMLLNQEPVEQCLIAYSLTPEKIAAAVEHKTPSVERRLSAMQSLQRQGWQIGLRFDPLLYQSSYQKDYENLFESVFSILNADKLHSVSLGGFRLPKSFYSTLSNMYPDERLFASPLEEVNGQVAYKKQLSEELLSFCREQLERYLPADKIFICEY